MHLLHIMPMHQCICLVFLLKIHHLKVFDILYGVHKQNAMLLFSVGMIVLLLYMQKAVSIENVLAASSFEIMSGYTGLVGTFRIEKSTDGIFAVPFGRNPFPNVTYLESCH